MACRLEDMAGAFEAILLANGVTANIDVNCNLTRADTTVMQGIMTAQRIPYKLVGIGAEVLNVGLEFYINVQRLQPKYDTLADYTCLIGYKTGTFTGIDTDTGESTTYTYFSYLDFSTVSAPVIDMGTYTQPITISGTVTVKTASGAIIQNEVATSLTVGTTAGVLAVTSASRQCAGEVESPQINDQVFATAIVRTRAYNYTYTLLVLGDAISKRLLKAAVGIEPIGQNEVVTITETYPYADGAGLLTSTKSVVITSIQYTGTAGAFSEIQFTAQDAWGE